MVNYIIIIIIKAKYGKNQFLNLSSSINDNINDIMIKWWMVKCNILTQCNNNENNNYFII